MKFSVIMPSRIADYPSSAKNKEQKLLRAVNSVLQQKWCDWELLIIADGCLDTIDIVTKFIEDERVKLMKVKHERLWSGIPRNTGIEHAEGEWIVYLDIDDIYGENHLQIISDQLATYDWVWYNDIRYRPRLDYWYENECDIHTIGRHGTSNIAHLRSLNVSWPVNGKYAHDYHFTRELLKFPNNAKIRTSEYFVCHVPGTGNSGGYDL